MRINSIKLQSKLLRFLVCTLIFLGSVSAFAQEDMNIAQLSDYLLQEKVSLSQAIGKAHSYASPINVQDMKKKRLQVGHLQTLNQVKINSLDSFLAYQNRKLQQLSQKLKQLQQAVVGKTKALAIQEKIERINSEKVTTANSIQLIKENLKLAHAYQDVLDNVIQELELWESRHATENELERLSSSEKSVQNKLSEFYKKALALQHQRSENGEQDTLAIDESLLINTQEINLLQLTLAELNLQRKLLRAKYNLHEHPDIRTLQQVEMVYLTAKTELTGMVHQLSRMVEVLEDERQQSTNSQRKVSLSQLLSKVESRSKKINEQNTLLKTELKAIQIEIKKRLSSRQTLTDYQSEGFVDIVRQITEVPNRFYTYLRGLAYKVRDNYMWMDKSMKYLAWCTLLGLGIILWWFNYFLSWYLSFKNRSRLSGHLFDGVLMLIKRNMRFITGVVFLAVVVVFTQIPLVNYKMLSTTLIVWLTFRVLIQISRMVLLERISDESGKDVRLYYRLRRLFLIGGWTTVLMVIVHQLPSSLIVQDIINRLFMIFLMAVALVGFRSRDAIHHLLYPYIKTRKRYVRTAVLMLVFLLPFCLAITAIIGLVGYFNIAWKMSIFLMQLVLVISGYILTRGMMFDGLELLSEWMIKTLKNGWLWIEVILKPLDKILRALLLIMALALLCLLIGWHTQMPLLSHVIERFDYKLVNISGIHITIASLLEFIILISVFIWAAKWTREFGYRYLYRNARDAGIRNSFSVFTQYAVVLVGGLITLRVLGLDVSGMSVILGGLAVGMGFGLRDFASNIVGGLMLLIERPVREGDLITLGNYEGRVAHIGIRSMRVSSWDNMEVLIPNAETFNKPFTNWTHQDSIVRTVIPIKVSRGDDPMMVQSLILDVLAIIPEVLAEPSPQVYLKQIDDALIEFETRYFINVEQHTRFEVRSKVLFAVTAQFKAAGVKPPIPPLSIEIKEGEHYDAFINTNAPTKK